jgi:hypothetical protein
VERHSRPTKPVSSTLRDEQKRMIPERSSSEIRRYYFKGVLKSSVSHLTRNSLWTNASHESSQRVREQVWEPGSGTSPDSDVGADEWGVWRPSSKHGPTESFCIVTIQACLWRLPPPRLTRSPCPLNLWGVGFGGQKKLRAVNHRELVKATCPRPGLCEPSVR